MGLFTDGFKLLKKASEPLYKTPKSIQETIEIMAVAENGIFEVSRNKYSKCYRFQDINYTTATEDEQIGIFERYCKFLNSLDCNYKITINNKNKNMEDLRDKVLITEKNDGFNNYRRIYNDIIEEKIIEGRQGIEQERYLTITIERKNFEEAKAQFATLEATIHKAFIELGAEIVPLNGNERLKVLYDYYHLGDEGSFDFDIKKAKKVGADFKNDLCNGMVKYFPDHFEDESKYCKALFIKKYPSSLSDRFINEITSLPVHSITSIDVVPVPKDLTTKVLQKKYLGIESDIIKQQRVRNKNNDFSTEISYATKDVEETDADGNVTTVTKSVLYVNVTLKSYRDMISVYGFDSDQVEMLEQIMSPEFMGQLGYAGSGSGGGGGSPGVSSMTEDEINAILSGITDSRQKAVCSYALHRVGYPYSQELRDSGNYYDCSSLAYYSWKDAGVNISHGGATTAAAEAQGLDEAGKTVSYDEMQPGDLIFYSFTNNGRYKNISHVAVYVGNGKVVEALNERVGVVYRDVASVGKIVVIGRP